MLPGAGFGVAVLERHPALELKNGLPTMFVVLVMQSVMTSFWKGRTAPIRPGRCMRKTVISVAKKDNMAFGPAILTATLDVLMDFLPTRISVL
jgi:hypothetical protein